MIAYPLKTCTLSLLHTRNIFTQNLNVAQFVTLYFHNHRFRPSQSSLKTFAILSLSLHNQLIPTLYLHNHYFIPSQSSHCTLAIISNNYHYLSNHHSLTGRAGVSNQPWQGSWRDNVSVKLSSCFSNIQTRIPVR